MLIAGDIGGTKTLLGLYTKESGARAPIREKEYHSGEFSALEPMVRAFLAESGALPGVPRLACFDVAGPVVAGHAKLTNLPWLLDESAMQQDLGLDRVILLNDLKAIAYAVPRLLADETRILNRGKPVADGPIAVVAPGTGLGEAFLVWDGARYIAQSSEGGHADFAPADDTQAALWHYLAERFGHVSCERVCSGSGIPNLYGFLRDTGRIAETPGFAEKLDATKDHTPLIVHAGMEEAASNPLAAGALDLFVAILGAEAGNLALKVLATGGVYLAGGMPLRVGDRLADPRFLHAFAGKGRFSGLLQDVPVTLVTTNRVALIGAALYGLDQLDGI